MLRPSKDLKVVVLGPHFVGKTCIVNRYCNGSFLKATFPTVGAGFFTHDISLPELDINLMLWDTAGEERFKSVAPTLLHGANGLILVFDVTNMESFLEIDVYFELFINSCQDLSSKELPVLLLGNKCDLADQQAVDESAVQLWLQKNQVTRFSYVSALTGVGVQEAIDNFVIALGKTHLNEMNHTIQIDPVTAEEEQGFCC